MRLTESFVPTLREAPQDAEIISHKLLLKAGMIRKVASGIYSFLPLGLRSLEKVKNIIREEMNKAGALELLFPAILPREIWDETGRWDIYGNEMFKLKDRKGREFCLGPTHEEAVVSLARGELRSYKELPKTFYQIQTKYRDELRPRFGLMRAREFLMKDAYSFDASMSGLDRSYTKMFNAYKRIFKRCGLTTIPIEADSGAIGGKVSHEFVVISEKAGESEFVYCPKCGYAANIEAAKSAKEPEVTPEEEKPLQKVSTPNAKSIEEVSAFLNVPKEKLAKSLLYKVDNDFVLAVVRGDDELNEVKLKNLLNGRFISPASEEEVKKLMGASVGSVGPVGAKNVKVVIDYRIKNMSNFVTGANENGYHYINVNLNRDFKADLEGDIRNVKAGDPCPKCGAKLELYNGIEVGQTFKLGTKYSEKMNAKFLDRDGKEKYFIMGCYGIGVGRTLAAIIEEHYDEYGIKWPISVAPYEVEIIPLNMSDKDISSVADELYKSLSESNIEVLMDDRDDVSAGVKFNDADLIGIPIQIIVGRSLKKEGVLEIKDRESGEKIKVSPSEAKEFITKMIKEKYNALNE
jgi:prolyl-tRNA synthetase